MAKNLAKQSRDSFDNTGNYLIDVKFTKRLHVYLNVTHLLMAALFIEDIYGF